LGFVPLGAFTVVQGPPVYGHAFKKAISKSKLIRIAKAGHAVGQEKPAAVLKAIREFF